MCACATNAAVMSGLVSSGSRLSDSYGRWVSGSHLTFFKGERTEIPGRAGGQCDWRMHAEKTVIVGGANLVRQAF